MTLCNRCYGRKHLATAEFVVVNEDGGEIFLCWACAELFEEGQASPDSQVYRIEEREEKDALVS